MPKTIHRNEYRVLLRLLKAARVKAGFTQLECAAAMGRHQSFISDIERGIVRLDLVQLRDLCRVLKTDLTKFIRAFERELQRRRA